MAENNDGNILLTIFLKHQQEMNLEEIGSKLSVSKFWENFPPEGVSIVSWYVMMGIGQVVTLSVPPNKLREVNLVIEKCAWGSFKTEFYPTYDFLEVYKKKRSQIK